MLEVAEAEAAIFLLDGDAVQAERAHFGPEIARETVLGVDPRRERRDTVGRETPHRLADHVRILAQSEVQFSHHILRIVLGFR